MYVKKHPVVQLNVKPVKKEKPNAASEFSQ